MNIQLLNYFVNTYKDILRREGRGRKEKNANRRKSRKLGRYKLKLEKPRGTLEG